MRSRNGKLELKIPTFSWKQIGGDISADKYGGTIAEADGDHIELLKIQPVRDAVGESEAKDVGHPFWTREAWLDIDDLDPYGSNAKQVKSALQFIGARIVDGQLLSGGDVLGDSPETNALIIAEALFDYGRGDEGPAGWSDDIYADREVEWSYGGKKKLGEYLADEDKEFRREVLGENYAVHVAGEHDSYHEDEDDAIDAAKELAAQRKDTVTVTDTFDDEVVWSSDDAEEELEENGRRSKNASRHSGQMSQRVMSATKPRLDADLRKRYDFFKTFGGGGRVGHAAEGALNLARAEKIAEDRDWDVRWEDEQESWESFLGDEMTLDDISAVLWCGLYDSDEEDAELLDSLGGITFGHDSAENRRYKRYTAAELALEACMQKGLL